MTRVIVIESEPNAKCELCGLVSELRPYGPNRARVCFPCGMDHLASVEKHFAEDILGIVKKPN